MTNNSKYILSSALSKIHNNITTCLLADVQTYKFSYYMEKWNVQKIRLV